MSNYRWKTTLKTIFVVFFHLIMVLCDGLSAIFPNLHHIFRERPDAGHVRPDVRSGSGRRPCGRPGRLQIVRPTGWWPDVQTGPSGP